MVRSRASARDSGFIPIMSSSFHLSNSTIRYHYVQGPIAIEAVSRLLLQRTVRYTRALRPGLFENTLNAYTLEYGENP